MKKRKRWVYAMYKGEECICIGTREEICEKMNIAIPTFQFYRSNYYKKERVEKGKKSRMIIRIDGKDKRYGNV